MSCHYAFVAGLEINALEAAVCRVHPQLFVRHKVTQVMLPVEEKPIGFAREALDAEATLYFIIQVPFTLLRKFEQVFQWFIWD